MACIHSRNCRTALVLICLIGWSEPLYNVTWWDINMLVICIIIDVYGLDMVIDVNIDILTVLCYIYTWSDNTNTHPMLVLFISYHIRSQYFSLFSLPPMQWLILQRWIQNISKERGGGQNFLLLIWIKFLQKWTNARGEYFLLLLPFRGLYIFFMPHKWHLYSKSW